MRFEDMKQTIFFSAIVVLSILPQTSQSQNLGGLLKKAKDKFVGSDITTEEAGFGLKEALNLGIEEAVATLSADKGYLESPYKILLPEEAQGIIQKLTLVPGFEDFEKNLIEKMNKAAEIAAKKATPIFVDAVTALTFEDAMNILMGENDAATRYLEDQTHDQLYSAFLPVIQSSLDEVNAREYWRKGVTAYNKIPLVKKTNPELDDHVNSKALDGLFSLIEVKEEGIRTNVDQRTSDILKKVFSKQDG